MIDKLNRLLGQPQVLLEKPLIALMIGAAFVVVGILSLLFMQDIVFFLMSLAITAFCIYSALRLFRQVLDKEYTVVEGKCTGKNSFTFSRFVRVNIEDAELGVVACRLRKKAAERIMPGIFYRLYFMGTSAGREPDHSRFWAMEEAYGPTCLPPGVSVVKSRLVGDILLRFIPYNKSIDNAVEKEANSYVGDKLCSGREVHRIAFHLR